MGEPEDLGSMDREGMLYLPVRAKPKARPRVTVNGTFMPADYTQYKRLIDSELRIRGLIPRKQEEGPLSLEVIFGSEGMWFQLRPVSGHVRAMHVEADVDNLVGGLMDALQDATVFKDDKQVIEVHAWIDDREDG